MRILTATDAEPQTGSEANRRAWAFVRHGAGAIPNVKTQMHLLDTGTHWLPMSVNEGDEAPGNGYVVSPLCAYGDYAAYETRQLGPVGWVWPLLGLIAGARAWLKRGQIDRIVHVNNWLLSTNLYPADGLAEAIPALTTMLRDQYPGHAIGFRSLNPVSNGPLIQALIAQGYWAIPSRQVYLFDGALGADAPFLRHKDVHNDARLLRRTTYRRVAGAALTHADFERIKHLYDRLYLEKYSPLNPHFTVDWLKAGQRDGWLQLTALQSAEGRIDGVLGWFSNADVLTTPVVGYDTALPQKLGLYRLLSQITLEETIRRRALLNMSAGAAHFKRQRGGLAVIESSFVHVGHLPRRRQMAWRVLRQLLNRIGVPLMEALKR